MSKSEPGGVEKVREALLGLGYRYSLVVLPKSARTSVEAAEALGCDVAQIAKSLVFRGRDSGRGVLVVASGVNRVDEKRLGRMIGEKVQKPDADFVREVTGFTIGGVPPVGHANPLETLIDEDLLQYEGSLGCRGQSEGRVLARPERPGVNDWGSGDPGKVETRASGPCRMQQGGNW